MSTLSLPLWITLLPGWQNGPLFQSFATSLWPFTAPTSIGQITTPSEAKATLSFSQITPIPKEAWSFVSPAKWRGNAIEIRGRPKTRVAYAAVLSKPIHMTNGAAVVATGFVFNGGLLLGLENEKSQWAKTLLIGRGSFSVVLQAPSDGNYTIVFANNLPQGRRTNDSRISEVGLIEGSKF